MIETPIPPRLAGRPRDRRGYPVPYIVMLDANGKPDFRVSDTLKVMRVVELRLCGLCGQPMGRYMGFIGGPQSFQSHCNTDPPSHVECAEYALKVCPFLANPSMHYAEKIPMLAGAKTIVIPEMPVERPERFFLATAKSVEWVRLPSGNPVLQAGEWLTTRWFKDGQEITA